MSWKDYSSSVNVPQVSTSNTPFISNTAIAVNANANRKSVTIVNTGTNPLYVLYGNACTTTVFHAVLKACTVNDDGTGGSIYSDEYNGIVSIAGTSPRYVVIEM